MMKEEILVMGKKRTLKIVNWKVLPKEQEQTLVGRSPPQEKRNHHTICVCVEKSMVGIQMGCYTEIICLMLHH